MTNQVLVVEDNPVILKLVSEILKKQGYSVKTAKDGLSALNVLEEYKPDIIFTDLIIPKINGEMLCKIIRSKIQFKETYLVILSGIATEAELDFERLGVDACIAKGSNIGKHINAVLEKIKKGGLRGEQIKIYGVEDVFVREAIVGLIDDKKHLEIILANLSDGLIEVTSEGVMILANSAAEILLSSSQDQLIGSNFFEFFQGEDKQYVMSLVKNAGQKGEQATVPQPLRLENRYLILKACQLGNGPLPSCIIIMNDISERKQLEEELKLLSITDQLTGVYNRRAFEIFFDRERKSADRNHNPLSLILFDIDKFKNINDTYGHDIGDKILQEITKLDQNQYRETDFLFRWGGEEFVLLLPETGIDDAKIVAERLRSVVETWDFPLASKITISLGVSQYHANDNAETLIKRADLALYKAKKAGRNCFRITAYLPPANS